MLSKVLAVAKNEFLVSVKSKAFIIGVVMMPILMGGSLLVQAFFSNQVDTKVRKIVIVDRSGFLYPILEEANEVRNTESIHNFLEDGSQKQVQPRFLIEEFEEGEDTSETELLLSKRVRKGELFAFLIIDKEIVDPLNVVAESGHSLAYHTKTPTFRALPNWLRSTINTAVIGRRFEEANMEIDQVRKLNRSIRLTSLGLANVSSSGDVEKAKRDNELRTKGVPFISMIFMFMLVMMTAPALLNQVLEEKMQKISEVLISSVSPFELLMGKLLGTVITALALSLLYLGSVYYATVHFDFSDQIGLDIYAWFLLFLVMALFIYGSIFSAIGATCSEIKDSQSLMMPAMVFLMIPMFSMGLITEDPNGLFATIISLFPPSTPMTMMLRIASPSGAPLWQVLLSVGLTGVFTVVCVAIAGKVFRIGILSQGQTPSFAKILKWIFTK